MSLLISATALCASDFADALFKAGEKAEKAGDVLHAYLLYARAAQADPKNVDYLAKKTALRGVAAMSSRTRLEPEPIDSDAEQETAVDAENLHPLLPPPQLDASPDRKSFDIKGDARMIFERVASAYGIDAVFDWNYQAPPPFTFRMTDATYQEAFHALEAVTSSFVVSLSPKIAMVVRDTQQKRNEREPVAFAAIPLPEHMSAADAKEIMATVQSVLEIRRAQLDPGNQLLIVRDKASRVEAARLLVSSLARARAQIEVDVEFLEVAKTSSLGYGISLPNEISLANFSNILNNAVSAPSGFSTFFKIGGGASTFGLGIVTNASVFATLSKSTALNLLDAKVISVDGMPVSLLVGNRYPIVTNTYLGNTGLSNSAPGSQAGQVFTPPPTVNYEDLGLTLKITPAIHAENEVTLDVDAEFKVLGPATPSGGIPIINNRKFLGKIRLKENEWAIVTGLVSTTSNDSYTGYPGISRVPVLRQLLGQTNKENDATDIILVLKPHLLNLPPWEFETHSFWVGTDTRPLTIF